MPKSSALTKRIRQYETDCTTCTEDGLMNFLKLDANDCLEKEPLLPPEILNDELKILRGIRFKKLGIPVLKKYPFLMDEMIISMATEVLELSMDEGKLKKLHKYYPDCNYGDSEYSAMANLLERIMVQLIPESRKRVPVTDWLPTKSYASFIRVCNRIKRNIKPISNATGRLERLVFNSLSKVPYARKDINYYKGRVSERMKELKENDKTFYEVLSGTRKEINKAWHPGHHEVSLEDYVDNHITLLLFMFKALFLPLYTAAQVSYFCVD